MPKYATFELFVGRGKHPYRFRVKVSGRIKESPEGHPSTGSRNRAARTLMQKYEADGYICKTVYAPEKKVAKKKK